MRIRTASGAVSAMALVALLIGSAMPAFAASPCPPGQPTGRPPGVRPGAPGQPTGRPSAYPPRSRCQLQLSQSVAAAGESVTVSGSGYAASSAVQLSFDGGSAGSATTDGSGAFSAALTVPSNAEPGSHSVAASGVDPNGEAYVLSATLEVSGAGASGGSQAGAAQEADGGALPRTGSDSTIPGALAGAMLVAVGACFVIIARRRLRSSATD